MRATPALSHRRIPGAETHPIANDAAAVSPATIPTVIAPISTPGITPSPLKPSNPVRAAAIPHAPPTTPSMPYSIVSRRTRPHTPAPQTSRTPNSRRRDSTAAKARIPMFATPTTKTANAADCSRTSTSAKVRLRSAGNAACARGVTSIDHPAFSPGYSNARAAARRPVVHFNVASAVSSIRRAITVTQGFRRSPRRSTNPGRTSGCRSIGTHTWGTYSRVVPSKRPGMTPRTRTATSFTHNVRPTTPGSAPQAVRQKYSLMTAVRAPSPTPKVRPRIGATPSTVK